jgi:hypothetical protein
VKHLRDFDITSFLRFFIGGKGPIQSPLDRLLGALLIALFSASAVVLLLNGLSAVLWCLIWLIKFSTTPIEGLDGAAKTIGTVLAISFGITTLMFVAKKISERFVPEDKPEA